MKKQTLKGFTLIELMVVIGILAILASMILIALSIARTKARDAKRAADIRQMVTALEEYYNDNGSYPAQPTADIVSATVPSGLSPNYFGTAPVAPIPTEANCTGSGTDQVLNNNYVYQAPAAGDTYTLSFCIGSQTGNFAPGTHTATPQGIF